MFKKGSSQYGVEKKSVLIFLLISWAVVFTHAISHKEQKSLFSTDQRIAREPPCPDEAAIEPCFCYTVNNDSYAIVMDCSNVETEEQLETVFLADFPTREYQHFLMKGNKNLTRLGDVFHGTTFRYVYLYQVVVEVITGDCFIASADTLIKFVVDGSMLNTSSFPFDTIGNYSRLTVFEIDNSKLDSVPDMVSESLTDLWLQQNEIVGLLPASALRNTPNLTEFHIYDNLITEIEPGAFNSLRLLRTVSMVDNLVSVLRTGTFVIDHDVNIGLSSNSLTAVEPGAFTRVNNDVRMLITLSTNYMTEVIEYVWEDVLLSNHTSLSLSNNPLVCGCDVTWLLFNPSFLAQLDPATSCQDGRLLQDLNPAEYAHC